MALTHVHPSCSRHGRDLGSGPQGGEGEGGRRVGERGVRVLVHLSVVEGGKEPRGWRQISWETGHCHGGREEGKTRNMDSSKVERGGRLRRCEEELDARPFYRRVAAGEP